MPLSFLVMTSKSSALLQKCVNFTAVVVGLAETNFNFTLVADLCVDCIRMGQLDEETHRCSRLAGVQSYPSMLTRSTMWMISRSTFKTIWSLKPNNRAKLMQHLKM